MNPRDAAFIIVVFIALCEALALFVTLQLYRRLMIQSEAFRKFSDEMAEGKYIVEAKRFADVAQAAAVPKPYSIALNKIKIERYKKKNKLSDDSAPADPDKPAKKDPLRTGMPFIG